MKKTLIIIIAILLIGTGLFIGIRKYCDIRSSDKIYADAQDTYVLSVGTNDDNDDDSDINILDDAIDSISHAVREYIDIPEKTSINTGDEATDNSSSDDGPAVYNLGGAWQDKINVDILTLTKQYPDVKGWLFFENEDISYPIVQAESDSKYMNISYTGKKVSAGSIFMEALNASDFSDAHTIIYGHNMKNHSMFGKLRNYLEQPQYYKNHQYFQIIKIDSNGKIIKNRYKIFAYCKTDPNSMIYTVCREHDNKYADIINSIVMSSANNTGVPVSAENFVVTLSTCSTKDERLTVSAVLVDMMVY